jgi:hypothetical protein
MQNPYDFMKVFNYSCYIVFILYEFICILNILSFNDNLEEILLFNFPYLSLLDYFIKIGYCFSILLGFPLNIYPIFSFVEEKFV